MRNSPTLHRCIGNVKVHFESGVTFGIGSGGISRERARVGALNYEGASHEAPQMCAWIAEANNEVAKRDNGPANTGPSSLVKGGLESMVKVNLRFNLVVRFSLRWIAALLYLFR